MASGLKVLIISYHFPPTAEVGAKRVARFCRYLPDHGIQPVILTVNPDFYEAVDGTFPEPPGVQVVRTQLEATALDRYLRWKRKARPSPVAWNPTLASQAPVEAAPVRGFLRRQLLAMMRLPDRQSNWYRPALEAGSRLLEDEPAAALLSSAPPYTCHLIAGQLKRRYGIPWILDFRDAWTCDPWRSLDELPRWRNWTDRWLQRRCLRLADAVVCVTDEMRAEFMRRHRDCPAEKFVTITNGFDETELPPLDQPPPSARRLFVHLGTLYGDRRIGSFCRALSQLVSEGAVDPATFKILFVGDVDPSFTDGARQEAPDLTAAGVIEFRPRVAWDEGQRLLAAASVLLVFQGHHKETIPAKIFEYVCAGKPIFAVVDGGAMADLVDRAGLGHWAHPDDTSDIAAKFLQTIRMPQRSADEVRQGARRYHFRYLTSQLADLIHHVVQKRRV